jgi:hypothetical protein
LKHPLSFKYAKQLISLLLYLCLISTSVPAANYYNNQNNNDWRSLAFIEMMASMMKAMNQVLGNKQTFSNLDSLPYSTTFVPGLMNGMNAFNQQPLKNLPMSPIGQPTLNHGMTDQLNPSISDRQNTMTQQPTDLNGIWQALSGDVIAIYNNNRFLWSNGDRRNISGQLAIKGNRMIAYVPAKKMTLFFQFYQQAGSFLVRDKQARVYRFKRIY